MTSLFLKMYLVFLSPFICAVLSYFASTSLGLNHGLSFVLVLICLVFAIKSLVTSIARIAELKRKDARKKYENRDFSELKNLFLANPHEAALFVAIKSAKNDRIENKTTVNHVS